MNVTFFFYSQEGFGNAGSKYLKKKKSYTNICVQLSLIHAKIKQLEAQNMNGQFGQACRIVIKLRKKSFRQVKNL